MSPKLPITLEQIKALPPEAQALVIVIIVYYERRIAELEAKLNEGKKTQGQRALWGSRARWVDLRPAL